MLCKICNKEVDSKSVKFYYHLKNHHNLSIKEYYDEYLKKPNDGICVSCGKPTRFINLKHGYLKHCCYKCSNNDVEDNKNRGNSISFTLKNKSFEENKDRLYKNTITTVANHFNCSTNEAVNYCKENNITNIAQLDWIKEKLHTEEINKKISKKCSLNQKTITNDKRNELNEKFFKTCIERYGKYVFTTNYVYNNIHFHSSWELAYYIWLRDHNIKFEYQLEPILYEVNGIKKKYIIDFKVNDTLIEIKNDYLLRKLKSGEDEKLKSKYECMLKNNVKILTDDDIKPYLKYIDEKYGKNYLKQFKRYKNET